MEVGIPDEGSKEYGTDSGKSAYKKTADLDQVIDRKAKSIFVAQVLKGGRNAFHNMITVGRTPNNDIVVPHPCVSKFHAFFREEAPGEGLNLWDAGSSYGTKVDGKRLGKTRGLLLKGREVIVFAESVRATYLLSRDFYDYMRLF
ncbi:MAG: FHA domain-containing protein [Planctomycetota bacterium]|jgi:pSer/pThr/pTyr-binding forkhead associated (FHA) protein